MTSHITRHMTYRITLPMTRHMRVCSVHFCSSMSYTEGLSPGKIKLGTFAKVYCLTLLLSLYCLCAHIAYLFIFIVFPQEQKQPDRSY